MTDQEILALRELKGSLFAYHTIAENDGSLAESTLPQMKSDFYKGYYQGATCMHKWYSARFKHLLEDLARIIEEAESEQG